MNSIRSLKTLVDRLPSCSGPDYVRIARNMEIDPADFVQYMHWNTGHYTRNCIARSEKYELILLCWEPGQITPIHCHGGEECWVYMVQGELEEFRYEKDPAKESIQLVDQTHMKAGQLSYMNDMMGFHKLSNIYPGRSMSLHLYMNPIAQCNIYDEDKGCFNERNLKYYSLEGEILEATV